MSRSLEEFHKRLKGVQGDRSKFNLDLELSLGEKVLWVDSKGSYLCLDSSGMRDVNHVPGFNLIEGLGSKEFVIVDLGNFKTKSSEVYLRLFKEEEGNPNVIIWDRETNTKIFTKIEYTVSLNGLNEDEKTLLKNLIIEKLKKDSSGDLSAMIDKFLDS